MNSTITVIGLLEKNSGKTFLIKNLITLLKKQFRIIPFKPISGSNFWHHPENTRYAIKNKLILSQDLRLVVDEVTDPLSIPLSILNPIHTLFLPENISDLIKRKKTIEQIIQSNYWSIDKPVMIRYSIWDELKKSERKIHITAKNYVPSEITQLIDSCDENYFFESLEELRNYDQKYSQLSINSTYNHVKNIIQEKRKESILFIEGFNNVVPFSECIKDSKLILVVGPGNIGLFDSSKFYKAFTFFKKEFLTINKFLEYLKPESVFSIPFDPKQNDWEKIITKINLF